jgi:hypothetical protein
MALRLRWTLSLLVACSDATLPHMPPGWWQPKIADCDGGDVGATTGSAAPDPDRCASLSDNGLVAVCWDQVSYANPAMAGPWCTYKDRPVSNCSGGSHPGLVFECYRP